MGIHTMSRAQDKINHPVAANYAGNDVSKDKLDLAIHDTDTFPTVPNHRGAFHTRFGLSSWKQLGNSTGWQKNACTKPVGKIRLGTRRSVLKPQYVQQSRPKPRLCKISKIPKSLRILSILRR